MKNNLFSRDKIDIYISEIPDKLDIKAVYPPERASYIFSSSNLKKQKERYWVWKTLEEAAKRSFGLKIEDVMFSNDAGKWKCNSFHFSLSHSENVVAVAVSNHNCGIDIECFDRLRNMSPEQILKLSQRICTYKELASIDASEDVISIWTKKESIYKYLEPHPDSLLQIESSEYNCITCKSELGNKFILSVCCDFSDNISINIL